MIRMCSAWSCAASLAVLTTACSGDGDDAGNAGSASFSGSAGTDTAASASASGSSGGTSDSGSASATDASGSASASATDSASSGSTGGVKFDVNGTLDVPPGDCDCGDASEFSYIWVANSPESTVSKIDTTTVQEVGRYLTRPDGAGDPSRTSVSLSGRSVAVANRYGGLVKIWANEADCEDTNGVAGIQTSTGAGNVLPWDQDECVDWYLAFPTWTVQRPVAWAPGDFNEVTCQWENEMVWTAGCGGGFQPGFGGDSTTHVHLVNGDTGLTEQVVDVTNYSCSGFGPYGGAVDSVGNLWLIQNNGQLAFIDRVSFAFTIFDKHPDTAPYGLTVDSEGRPWVTSYSQTSGVARFDPSNQTWDAIYDATLISIGQSGIAQGKDGRVWVAGSFTGVGNGIAGIDPELLTVTDVIPVAGSSGKGVSGDGAGFIWRAGGNTAARIHPDDYTFQLYNGLNSAYTYSDMTGFGVANASGCTPAG